jgi:hypothetical protein
MKYLVFFISLAVQLFGDNYSLFQDDQNLLRIGVDDFRLVLYDKHLVSKAIEANCIILDPSMLIRASRSSKRRTVELMKFDTDIESIISNLKSDFGEHFPSRTNVMLIKANTAYSIWLPSSEEAHFPPLSAGDVLIFVSGS